MRLSLIIPFALVLNITLFAQKRFDEWGEVSPEDKAMTVYPADTSAAAVILHDIGSTQIDDDGQRWFVNHRHVRRIKIFKLASFDQSQLNIYIRAGRDGEILDKIKVQHILPDGTIQRVKSDNLRLEKVSKYYKQMKIFVPQLQDGSIIEYQYELESEYLFALYDWYFHQQLPVRWSEITTHIRKEFEYQFLARSERPFDDQTKKTLVDNSATLRLGLANLPAMKDEPYMTTLDDYRAHVGFQLSRTYPVGAEPRNIMVSWEKTARDILDRDDFGKQFEKKSNFSSLWEAFEPQLVPGESPMMVAEKVVSFVKSSIGWNGYHNVLTDKDLNDAYAKKTGSSADINLAVVALLQKAGLDAIPVLVSTRDNGTPYENYPFIRQFNSVLAMLNHGDQHTLLDATHPFMPLGQLRSEYYNNRGWPVVAKKESPWIDIVAPETNIVWQGSLKLDDQGQITGKFDITSTSRTATNWRNKISLDGADDFLKKNFAEGYPDAAFDSIAVENQNDLNKPLKVKFGCKIPNTSNVVNDFIYLKPILDFAVKENPFKSLTREFPVNFNYPFKAQYVIDLTLPDGYNVEEMPASARIVMPDQAGSIVFSCNKMSESSLVIILKMTISKCDFPLAEYEVLRKFFDMVNEKANTQIVLKKS